MPNPSSISSTPGLLAAGTSQATVELNGLQFHELIHTGLDESGSAATTAIFLTFGSSADTLTAVATMAASSNKAVLLSGARLTIPPGCTKLAFITASGAPTFLIVPGARTLQS